MIETIRKARSDIDALSLTRQLSELQGTANPLLTLGMEPNPNPVLAASLDGGFDAVLDYANRKRKLKSIASTVVATRKAVAGELPGLRIARRQTIFSISILR